MIAFLSPLAATAANDSSNRYFLLHLATDSTPLPLSCATLPLDGPLNPGLHLRQPRSALQTRRLFKSNTRGERTRRGARLALPAIVVKWRLRFHYLVNERDDVDFGKKENVFRQQLLLVSRSVGPTLLNYLHDDQIEKESGPDICPLSPPVVDLKFLGLPSLCPFFRFSFSNIVQ